MNKEIKIVPVSQKEASLIHAANEIEAKLYAESRAREEAASKEAGKPLHDPMLIFDTPKEGDILKARDQLAQEYKQTLNLDVTPTLIAPIPLQPGASSGTWSPSGERFHQYHRRHDGPMSPTDLEELFLLRVFIKRCNDNLFAWNQTHYQHLTDKKARGLIMDTLREEMRAGNAKTMTDHILSLLQSESRIEEVAETEIDGIAVRNGMVELATLRLIPTNPNLFNTHFLNVNWLGKSPCPSFQSFLQFASGGDYELYIRMLEAIGFLLTPGNQAKRFVLLQGLGDSGKSVLSSLIQDFYLPGDVSSLALHQFGERFSMSVLEGHHLNVAADLPSGLIDNKSVAILKSITGGDRVAIEPKGKTAYAGIIHSKLLFATNYTVELQKPDPAFARRVLLIPFFYQVPENQRDFTLLEKLKVEKPGILYHALEAYRNVVQRGYQFTGEERFGFKQEDIQLPTPPSDSIPLFIAQHCQLAPETFTSTEALHMAFLAFCRENGVPSILDRAAFSRALKLHLQGQIASLKKRVNGIPLNGYVGIQLIQ